MSSVVLPGTLTSIIDNLGENTLLHALERRTENGQELSIATAFFSLDALNLLGPKLRNYNRIRLLFGDDASARQRSSLLKALRETSDKDLLKQRDSDPLLNGLRQAADLIAEGRLEARCYTKQKFHAKAYLVAQPYHPPLLGIIGSGNFTRPGLTQNIELNVDLTVDQSAQLRRWFEERWNEAQEDEVTEEIRLEILRQIQLVDPHAIYLKSLLAWGDYVQGRDSLPDIKLKQILDPHQETAYRQSLKILDREHGVMVCDGVGLGKSFVALALMEHFLRAGKRVLLVAPKAILDNSWIGYLTQYLDEFRAPFGSLHYAPMTFFGFAPGEGNGAEDGPERTVRKLAEQADVIVVDESHNFRTTESYRYQNLHRVVAPNLLGRKKIILLTATPINTEYQDIAAQFGLIAPERSTLGGVPLETIKKNASALDRNVPWRRQAQGNLFSQDFTGDRSVLDRALLACVIQRSRKTCKELAAAAGQELRFPDREGIAELEYELSQPYRLMVERARQNFEELAKYLAAYTNEISRASGKGPINSNFAKLPQRGLKFSAYLPDRYRTSSAATNREAQVEAFLAKLVFVNVMKQLESSVVAFQGILQALGAGLCARLQTVFGEGVEGEVARHRDWINEPLRYDASTFESYGQVAEEPEVEDGEAAEASGEEMDDWIERAIRSRAVRKSLAGFGPETHDVKAWRKDILSDLKHLQEIHEECVAARSFALDPKLEEVARSLRMQLATGKKCLVFTQSKRTARYLERRLPALLGKHVARVASDVDGDRRRRILHAFSPRYNPLRQGELFDGSELDVLVCTDVLSEGVNLQEAGCILNYDIHWNPVRLIQRIGRVDRRLQPDDAGHRFCILNVFPPKEIDQIIKLVGIVEGRKGIISRVLGIDVSFLKATDEEGTLREFNKTVDGETTLLDRAHIAYSEAVRLSEAELKKALAVPPGGFGVWKGAPGSDMFALFTLQPRETVPQSDLKHFAPVIGRPVLALTQEDVVLLEAPAILDVLSRTSPVERSGAPSDAEFLSKSLAALKKSARAGLRDLNLTQGFYLRLECWMELRS